MNTSDIAPSPNSFEQRMISVERGVRLFGVTILLLTSAPNLALAFSIQSYAANFPTLIRLPSLPALAQSVFAHPIYLVVLALLWPLVGSFITFRAKDPFRAMIASCVYLVLVTVQFTITWFAFIAPIRELIALLPRQ